MSAIGYSGRLLKIYIDGEIIAAVRQKSAGLTRSPIDNTHEFKDGWKHVLPEEDQRSHEVSASGVATSANYSRLFALWSGVIFADLEVRHADGSKWTGDAFLSGLSFGGESAGYVSFDLQLSFSGEVITTTGGGGGGIPVVITAGEQGGNVGYFDGSEVLIGSLDSSELEFFLSAAIYWTPAFGPDVGSWFFSIYADTSEHAGDPPAADVFASVSFNDNTGAPRTFLSSLATTEETDQFLNDFGVLMRLWTWPAPFAGAGFDETVQYELTFT